MPGAPGSNKTFFGLHLYLAEKYCENLKVPEAQLNVNPVLAITCFVGVTVYGTYFNNNSPPCRQFLSNKILLKKLAAVRGILIKQIFEFIGSEPLSRIFTPAAGGFHDKTIISKENIQLDCN